VAATDREVPKTAPMHTAKNSTEKSLNPLAPRTEWCRGNGENVTMVTALVVVDVQSTLVDALEPARR
jgi:hypothetical protein